MKLSSYSLSSLTKFILGTVCSLLAIYLYLINVSIVACVIIFVIGFALEIMAIFSFYQLIKTLKNIAKYFWVINTTFFQYTTGHHHQHQPNHFSLFPGIDSKDPIAMTMTMRKIMKMKMMRTMIDYLSAFFCDRNTFLTAISYYYLQNFFDTWMILWNNIEVT